MLDDFDEEVFSLDSSEDSCEEDEKDAAEIRLDNEYDENEEEEEDEEDEDNYIMPATPKVPTMP
jgi:hypothetical protein